METLCQGGGIVQALNTHVYGNGTQTLVLAHGSGSDRTVWHFLIPFLACYFKVVIFDWVYSPNVDPKLYDPKRYSNFSAYADDLVCLLNHLNVGRTVYMGHSMAAMVGCIASIQRPHLFQHLILLSGSPRGVSSAVLVETMAAQAAVLFARNLGVMKGDTLVVIYALQRDTAALGNDQFGNILQDTSQMLKSFLNWKASFGRRETNKVAHQLARLGLTLDAQVSWFEEPPNVIFDLPIEDSITT